MKTNSVWANKSLDQVCESWLKTADDNWICTLTPMGKVFIITLGIYAKSRVHVTLEIALPKSEKQHFKQHSAQWNVCSVPEQSATKIFWQPLVFVERFSATWPVAAGQTSASNMSAWCTSQLCCHSAACKHETKVIVCFHKRTAGFTELYGFLLPMYFITFSCLIDGGVGRNSTEACFLIFVANIHFGLFTGYTPVFWTFAWKEVWKWHMWACFLQIVRLYNLRNVTKVRKHFATNRDVLL